MDRCAEIRISHFVILRAPEDGDHPTWRVYESEDEESLVCVCSYRKGAVALVGRLLEYEAIIRDLRSRKY